MTGLRLSQIQNPKPAINPPSPITTLTIFHLPRRSRAWGAAQFPLARRALAGTPGLRFWKILGAGKGGSFSVAPDWGRQGLIAVWDSLEHARGFHAGSRFIERYRRRASRISTLYLETLSAHGAWGGVNPFGQGRRSAADRSSHATSAPIAVLTRATIRARHLPAFWRGARPVNAILPTARGLLGSIGVGEAPWLRQATVSLWGDEGAIEAFAYRMAEHRGAIHRARAEKWYAEELFARFTVLEVVGEFP